MVTDSLKKILKYSLFIVVLTLSSLLSASEKKVRLDFFFQPGCNECEMIKRLVFPKIADEFPAQFVINEFDIQLQDNFMKLLAFQESLKITENEPVTIIVDGKVALCGYGKIDAELENVIRSRLANTDNAELANPAKFNEDKIFLNESRFTIIAISAAGLADGFNPCVFSTLIFLTSLLSVAKVGRQKLVAVGIVYCLATFLTYVTLGFGVFHFIKAFSGFFTLKMIFNSTISFLLLIVALISFRDAYRYYRNRDAKEIFIQLPDKLKHLTHSLMRSGLKYRYLLPGTFLIGVIVTVVESVCTGQLYIPALTLMVKDSQTAFQGLFLLFIYNFMFIIPLIIIFILAYLGTAVHAFLSISRKNIIPSKIIIGTVLLIMAVLLFV